MLRLSDGEQAFLHAIREGQSAAGYAREHNYSPDWAKWISRRIRDKLGVSTLQEAWEMSEGATITKADLDALHKRVEELAQAQADLSEASTTRERDDARRDVRDARSDLADELRARGLTTKDLDRIQEIKETEKFEKFYAKKRQEEEDAKPKRRRKPKPKEEPEPAKKEPNAFAKLFAPKRDESEDEEGDEEGEED